MISESNYFEEAVNPEHFRKLERMYSLAPINRYFNPKILVDAGYAEICIPIRPEFHHAANAVHGSVYFKAMDDAAFFAVQFFNIGCICPDSFLQCLLHPTHITRRNACVWPGYPPFQQITCGRIGVNRFCRSRDWTWEWIFHAQSNFFNP